MKLINLFFVATVLQVSSCKSQNLNEFETISRNKADLVASSYFKSELGAPYLLMTIGNSDYLIISGDDKKYKQALITLDKDNNVEILSETRVELSDMLLEKAFNRNIYHKDFIGFDSDYFKNGYELSSGGTVYFVMKDDKGKRYGESSLSVIIKPNPIDKEIFSYMVSELINFNANDD